MEQGQATETTYSQGFTMIPNWVLMHPDLGRCDIAVYLVLAYHADNDTRTCYPGRKLIMAEAGMGGDHKLGKRHLATCLARLEEVGAIEVCHIPGYPNRYHLPLLPPCLPPCPPRQQGASASPKQI